MNNYYEIKTNRLKLTVYDIPNMITAAQLDMLVAEIRRWAREYSIEEKVIAKKFRSVLERKLKKLFNQRLLTTKLVAISNKLVEKGTEDETRKEITGQ